MKLQEKLSLIDSDSAMGTGRNRKGRDRLSEITPEKDEATVGSCKNKELQVQVLDINKHPISLEWASEFRGFFWGEGCLTIQNPSSVGGVAVRATITAREDDLEILWEFKKRLGGNVYTQKVSGNSKPAFRWQVSKTEDLHRVGLILLMSSMPFRKSREVKFWMEAVDIKLRRQAEKRHRRFTDAERKQLVALKTAMQESRNFNIKNVAAGLRRC